MPQAEPQDPLRYFASCAAGLEEILATELSGVHVRASRVRLGTRGVEFDGDTGTGYRALLWVRTANRVLELLADERDGINSADALYAMTRECVDWRYYLSESGTLGVDTVLGNTGPDLRHSHFCALTVKNAIVDQFREASRDGQGRPSVDPHDPDLPVVAYLHRGGATLYRSLGGTGSLHKRGYRGGGGGGGGNNVGKGSRRSGAAMHAASLRETLAAGILLMAGWPERCDHAYRASSEALLLDPMCGSGTIAIEAALIARGVAPGLLRLGLFSGGEAAESSGELREGECGSNRQFAVQRFLDVESDVWRASVREAVAAVRGKSSSSGHVDFFHVMANDWHPGALKLGRTDAEAAGVARDITFSEYDAADWHLRVSSDGFESPGNDAADTSRSTMVVSNPPWDLRIGGADEAWSTLGQLLRRESYHCSDAWFLCGNADVTRHLRMKAARRRPITSGGVDLRLLHYKVLPPKVAPTQSHPEATGARAQNLLLEHDSAPEVDGAILERGPLEEIRGSLNEEDYWSLTIPKLKDELRLRGLKVSGRKGELIKRLLRKEEAA